MHTHTHTHTHTLIYLLHLAMNFAYVSKYESALVNDRTVLRQSRRNNTRTYKTLSYACLVAFNHVCISTIFSQSPYYI